jgi:hypothetical protein
MLKGYKRVKNIHSHIVWVVASTLLTDIGRWNHHPKYS